MWSTGKASDTAEFELTVDEHEEAKAMRAVHDSNMVEEA
jgi:hypothetical protein